MKPAHKIPTPTVSLDLTTTFVRVEFPRPTSAERARLWKRALHGVPRRGAAGDLPALANAFRLSGGQIRDAVATARNLARWRGPAHARLSLADLTAACRLHSNLTLATLARHITPHSLLSKLS